MTASCVQALSDIASWTRVTASCVQALTDMVELAGAEVPQWLAVRVEGALAMLAYARAELVWWFRHWKEVTYSSSGNRALTKQTWVARTSTTPKEQQPTKFQLGLLLRCVSSEPETVHMRSHVGYAADHTPHAHAAVSRPCMARTAGGRTRAA